MDKVTAFACNNGDNDGLDAVLTTVGDPEAPGLSVERQTVRREGSFLDFAGYSTTHSTRENDIIKRFAAAAVLAATVAGASAGPALADPADREPTVAVAAPLNPISATLQKFIAGLSFIGGQELPGCTIPTGC